MDSVHDLRVAIRRLNQAIALGLQNGHGETLHRRLKKTMRLAGDVRNADITLKLVSKLKRTATLRTRLHRRRDAAQARLLGQLRGWAVQEADTPDPAPPEDALLRAARRLFRRARKPQDPATLHRMRIAAKKLRYTIEILAPDHPRLEQVKQIQSQLGDINDFETARAIVKEESGAKSVRDELKRKQETRIRKFRSLWTSLFPDANSSRQWLNDFAKVPARKRVRSS